MKSFLNSLKTKENTNLVESILEGYEAIFETKAKSEFKKLQDNKVPLTDEERSKVMKAKAVWHHGPNGEETPAVWKSVNPKTGETTYISNTHRAWDSRKTVDAAINLYHNFIKGTA